MKKMDVKKTLIQLLPVLAGNFLIAVAVNAFIIPGNFISGGSTGLALVLNHFLNIPYSFAVTSISWICFILGLVCLGLKFAGRTLISAILYPIFFNLTAGLGQAFDVNEPMLYAILAGVLMGCGLGMILQADASSGGLDIPPIILEKKFGLPVSATMWAMDVVLLVLQISQASILSISYGVIYMALTYVTMNQILSSGKHAVEMLVYTPKSEEVLECILHDQDRGASLIHVKSGYLKQEGYAVHSIFRKKDLAPMQKAVFDIDPDAFVIISNVRQVRGTGFYPAKYSDLKKANQEKETAKSAA